MCMTLPPDHVAGVRRPGAKTSTGEEEAPRPATRKEGGRGEGEREERKKPEPGKKRPLRKNPRRSLPQNLAKTLYPNKNAQPRKSYHYTAEVLPTKLCTQTSLRREELKKARLTKENFLPRGFSYPADKLGLEGHKKKKTKKTWGGETNTSACEKGPEGAEKAPPPQRKRPKGSL